MRRIAESSLGKSGSPVLVVGPPLPIMGQTGWQSWARIRKKVREVLEALGYKKKNVKVTDPREWERNVDYALDDTHRKC